MSTMPSESVTEQWDPTNLLEPGKALLLPALLGSLVLALPPAATAEDGDYLEHRGCEPPSQEFVEISQCGRVHTSVRLVADLVTTQPDCLLVTASGIEIDGNGYSIQAAQRAVNVHRQSCVTVRNVTSPQPIQVYGDEADGVALLDSAVGGAGIHGADRNVVARSVLHGLVTRQIGDFDPSQNHLIVDNEVSGAASRLVFIQTGGIGDDLCVEGNHDISRNLFLGTGNAEGNQVVFFYRCGSGSRITDNSIQGYGLSTGVLMRDEADDNLFRGNEIWVRGAGRNALSLPSGNLDKGHPRGNRFLQNLVVSEGGNALLLHAQHTASNLFQENVFWASNPQTAYVIGGWENAFDHNVFANDKEGGAAIHFRDIAKSSNVFSSNIFFHSGPSIFTASGATDARRYTGFHNVYFNRSGPVGFGSGTPVSFETFRAISQEDESSREVDPRFCAPVPPTGDFTLAEDSPVRGTDPDGGDPGAFPSAAAGCRHP